MIRNDATERVEGEGWEEEGGVRNEREVVTIKKLRNEGSYHKALNVVMPRDNKRSGVEQK
jgi:hypothetical protein